MDKLTELKKLITAFEAVQKKNARFGAQDTEPDWVFQAALVRAAKGKPPRVPQTAEGWELHTDMVGAETAASKLHEAASKVTDFIASLPLGEAEAVMKYLRDYTWRCNW